MIEAGTINILRTEGAEFNATDLTLQHIQSPRLSTSIPCHLTHYASSAGPKHEDIHALAKESHHLYTIARVGTVEELCKPVTAALSGLPQGMVGTERGGLRSLTMVRCDG